MYQCGTRLGVHFTLPAIQGCQKLNIKPAPSRKFSPELESQLSGADFVAFYERPGRCAVPLHLAMDGCVGRRVFGVVCNPACKTIKALLPACMGRMENRPKK